MTSRVGQNAIQLDDATAAALLPERPSRGHKGTFGKLLVIAGSIDYAGAAFLVSTAAGRAGAGLVTLAVPESLQPLFAAKVVEATTMALPEDDLEEVDPDEALARILDHDHDAIVVGPGLRPSLTGTELIQRLLAGEDDGQGDDDGEPCPMVLDAEALRSLATIDGWASNVAAPCVLTPHVGEFLRLRAADGQPTEGLGDLVADDERRLDAARDAAAEWGQTVVLKGARTVIAAADGRLAVAPFENPALASGGTGDVLAGTIGALLAQGLAPFEAAQLGVYLHGLAGEAVRARIGDAGLLALDLTPELPLARKRLAAISAAGRPPVAATGPTGPTGSTGGGDASIRRGSAASDEIPRSGGGPS